MTPLEHVGTLYCENQRLLAEYGNLLQLIQRTKDGEVQLSQINVDLAGAKWSIALTGEELAKELKSSPLAE